MYHDLRLYFLIAMILHWTLNTHLLQYYATVFEGSKHTFEPIIFRNLPLWPPPFFDIVKRIFEALVEDGYIPARSGT